MWPRTASAMIENAVFAREASEASRHGCSAPAALGKPAGDSRNT